MIVCQMIHRLIHASKERCRSTAASFLSLELRNRCSGSVTAIAQHPKGRHPKGSVGRGGHAAWPSRRLPSSTQSKAGDLPLPIGCTLAARHVRLQTGAATAARHGATGLNQGNQRVTGMTANQAEFPVVASNFEFGQHGQSGAWVSELMPHTAKIVDKLCFLKAVNTEAINHDPGITFLQTGHQQPGRPSLGAWLSYGLGSENQDLPGSSC